MRYRMLGNTGLKVGEIGIGYEALLGKDIQEARRFAALMMLTGANVIDMASPDTEFLDNLGSAIRGRSRQFVLQASIGTVLKEDATGDGGQLYTKDVKAAAEAFNEELRHVGTGRFEIGVIRGCETADDWKALRESGIVDYAIGIRDAGIISHIGLATNDIKAARAAVESGIIEVLTIEEAAAADGTTAAPPQDIIDLGAACSKAGIGITILMPYEPDPAHVEPKDAARALKRRISALLSIPSAACVIAGVHSGPEMMDVMKFED